MTSIQQRAALQRQIWAIANDVRGAVDGWDFKQYVLGSLFYRFISENFAAYIEGGDDSVNYAGLPDSVITPDIKDDAIKTKGYFIYPSQLFAKVAASANTNESLNTDLATLFAAIESSASGYPSEHDIKGLFADFDTTSNRLGNTVKDKNTRLAAVLKGVAELDFGDSHDGDFEDNQIDLFGDAYEFLISNYAANAGKSGGEFFTPQHVSRLIAQLYDLDTDGKKLQVVKYTEYSGRAVRTLYPTREALQSAWANPDTRAEVLRELTERGISFEELAASSEQPDADPFDLLCHLGWNAPLLTRRQRADAAKRQAQDLFAQHGETAREILSLLLDRYVERGILQFNALSELMKVQPFDRYGSPSEIATRHFGGVRGMKDAVSRLQTALYQ